MKSLNTFQHIKNVFFATHVRTKFKVYLTKTTFKQMLDCTTKKLWATGSTQKLANPCKSTYKDLLRYFKMATTVHLQILCTEKSKLDPYTHRMPAEKILEYLKIWALYNIVQCPCFRSKPKLQVINTILFLRHSPYKCWIKAKGIVRKYLSVRLCYDASG